MKTHAPVRTSAKSTDPASADKDGLAPPQRIVQATKRPAAPGALHDYSKIALPSGGRAADATVHAGESPPNRTRLPGHLKAGIERLSGLAMDDVRVHYNSPKPAQLQALAYARGTEIHVGPGQERHLPHEAWHVVQQKQGRVKPTLQMKAMAVNHDARLEHEADRIGAELDATWRTAKRLEQALPASPAATQSTRLLKARHIPGDGSRLPIQAKIDYPIKTKTALVANPNSLKVLLVKEFGSSTSPEMIDRYIKEVEEHPMHYSKIEDIKHQIDTRVGYNISGSGKWREFIDAKDHQAAQDAFERKEIDHPGKFYDYRQKQKVGEHFEAFMNADAFVSQRLNTKLSADEYFHINVLASQGITSAELKGERTSEVTWGLKNPDEKQKQNLAEQGLTDLRDDKSSGGVSVHVAMPKEGVRKFVQQKLDEYYSSVAKSQDSITRLSAIISLYQSLEAVHAFKDATSRTNHLVLNKLLAENGLEPAILNEPNSPTSSHDEFGRHVLEGIGQSRKMAAAAGPNRHAALAKEHSNRQAAIKASEMLKKMGMDPEVNIPPPRPKATGASIMPFYAQLDHLIGGQESREHIKAGSGSNDIGDAKSDQQHGLSLLDKQNIPAASMTDHKDDKKMDSVQKALTAKDVKAGGQPEPSLLEKNIPAAHSNDKKDDEKKPSAQNVLSARQEKRVRLILGKSRVDQYLAYRKKKDANSTAAS